MLNSQRPSVAPCMNVSNFTSDVTVVNTSEHCEVSDVSEHKTGSKLTATVLLTMEDYAFYNEHCEVSDILLSSSRVFLSGSISGSDQDSRVEKLLASMHKDRVYQLISKDTLIMRFW